MRATGNNVLIRFSDQLAFIERMINNTILPVHFATDYAMHHLALVRAIVENDLEGVQRELQHSQEKVEGNMRRIAAAFLDTGAN